MVPAGAPDIALLKRLAQRKMWVVKTGPSPDLAQMTSVEQAGEIMTVLMPNHCICIGKQSLLVLLTAWTAWTCVGWLSGWPSLVDDYIASSDSEQAAASPQHTGRQCNCHLSQRCNAMACIFECLGECHGVASL